MAKNNQTGKKREKGYKNVEPPNIKTMVAAKMKILKIKKPSEIA